MKKQYIIYFLLLVLSITGIQAQSIIKDSTRVQSWEVEGPLVKRVMVVPDTLPLNFQIDNPIYVESAGNTYDGNLGSPYLSQVFFNRNYKSDYLFIQPYNAYLNFPQGHYFFNTKDPYTNFTYHSAGSNKNKEEFVRLYFTRNVTPRWNLEAGFKQYFGRGMYANQSTNHLSYNFTTNYISPTYNIYITGARNFLRNFENGGISNDNYITNPELTGDKFSSPDQIPVNLLNARTQIRNEVLYLAQTYNLNVKVKNKVDSLPPEIVPFATLSHTLSIENNDKSFTDKGDTAFFRNTLGLSPAIDSLTTDDRSTYHSMKNTLGLDINEEINRWAKFGMGAFVEFETRRYGSLQAGSDSLGMASASELYTVLGGRIYKTQGTNFTYNAVGRIHLQGAKSGDFDVVGSAKGHFNLFKNELSVNLGAQFANTTPDYIFRNYYSNYYQWNNTFNKTITSRISGEVHGFFHQSSVYAAVENMSNYVYWGMQGLPTQYTGSIQIIQVGAKINLPIGRSFHFDNHIVYQKTSVKADILPLPTMIVNTNFYYSNILFKVLRLQIGVEGNYFTGYFAPTYSPSLGVYHTQYDVSVGSFPILSPYINFHLKRMRFFFKMYHINDSFSAPKYFTMPHYPLNPSMMKFGLSWNFYT